MEDLPALDVTHVPQTGSRGQRQIRTMGRSTSLKYLPGVEELSDRPPKEKTEEDHTLIMESMRNNTEVSKAINFSDAQLKMLADVAWKEVVEEGMILMSEGSLHNAVFYICSGGSFEIVAHEPFEVVTRNGMSYLVRPKEAIHKPQEDYLLADHEKKTVVHGGKNFTFGATSMIYGVPRLATLTATEMCTVWTICQSDFKVVQEMAKKEAPRVTSQADSLVLDNALTVNDNLQRLTPLDHVHVQALVAVAHREEFQEGKNIMKEGDLNADSFYIVGEGSIELSSECPFKKVDRTGGSYLKVEHGRTASKGNHGRTIVNIGKGTCFGEISMLYISPRVFTAKALSNCVLWTIDRASFQMIQMKAAEDDMKARVRHLSRLESLSTFTKEDKEKVAGAMEAMRMRQGDVLSRGGVACTSFYVLIEGCVAIFDKEGKPTTPMEADSSTEVVHYFGEGALAGNEDESQSQDIRVTSDTAIVLILEHENFRKIWDRLLEAAPSLTFQRYATSVTKMGGDTTDYHKMSDFSLVGHLGCVEFLGSVNLHVHKSTKEIYAVKTLDKGRIVQKGFRKSVMRERMIWCEAIHPFIIRVIATINEPQSLHFLLEVALGGELSCVYENNNFYGSANHARYYVAGVSLAIEHLHKRRIAYRNLKPRNVLVNRLGQPKLTDMSLAKLVVGHTFTTCGTPYYMAPEILAGVGHTRAADFWSLGCFVYSLMSVKGETPFQADHAMETYAKIMRGISAVTMPTSCQGPVGDLIVGLLQANPLDRLAMGSGGISNLFNHEWFSGFDWDAMRLHALPPPYVPPANLQTLEEVKKGTYKAGFSTWHEKIPQPVEYEEDPMEPWDDDFN